MKKKKRKRYRSFDYAGSKEYTDKCIDNKTTIKYIEYDKDKHFIEEIKKEEIKGFLGDEDGRVKWLKIVGLDDFEKINHLCSPLSLHPLDIEDILDTSKNSKIVDYPDYLF